MSAPDQPPAPLLDDNALAALAAIPAVGPVADEPPGKAPRKSRSGTTGAERRRRAKQAATGDKPPATPAKKSPPAKREPAGASLERELGDRLKLVVELLQLVDGRDAAVIEHNRAKLSRVLAVKYPRIAGALVKLLGFGDELDGLMLLGLVVGQIADNHGLLPAPASSAVRLGAMLTHCAPSAAAVAKASSAKDQLAEAMGPLVAVLTAPPAVTAPDEPTLPLVDVPTDKATAAA